MPVQECSGFEKLRVTTLQCKKGAALKLTCCLPAPCLLAGRGFGFKTFQAFKTLTLVHKTKQPDDYANPVICDAKKQVCENLLLIGWLFFTDFIYICVKFIAKLKVLWFLFCSF